MSTARGSRLTEIIGVRREEFNELAFLVGRVTSEDKMFISFRGVGLKCLVFF